MKDELGVIEAAHKQQERRLVGRGEQDLVVVSKGASRTGEVFIGSILTNSIVGEISVEIVKNNVVVTVRREDESLFGPVSLVVV